VSSAARTPGIPQSSTPHLLIREDCLGKVSQPLHQLANTGYIRVQEPQRSLNMQRRPLRGFTLVELMVVIAIIGLMASVLATSVVSKMRQASRELDKKTLQDLFNHIQMAMETNERARQHFARGELAEKRGREFWEGCFRKKILAEDMLPKMVCSAGDDIEINRRALDDRETFVLDAMGCSWTAPQGNEVFGVFKARGEFRRVAICVNSRNWLNHEDEILTIWSDGETAEYVSLEQMKEWGYAIDEEKWKNPVDLFGSVKPFDGVFE
jgi:prepilin-type N-terminal cleavage/methylation domain-containing protein